MYLILIIFMSLYTAASYSMDYAKITPPALVVNVSEGASIQSLASPLLTPPPLILDDRQDEIGLQPVREVQEELLCGCRERNFLIGGCLTGLAIIVLYFVIMKHVNT